MPTRIITEQPPTEGTIEALRLDRIRAELSIQKIMDEFREKYPKAHVKLKEAVITEPIDDGSRHGIIVRSEVTMKVAI